MMQAAASLAPDARTRTLSAVSPMRPESMTLVAHWEEWMAANDMSERTRELYVYAVLRLMRHDPGKHLLDYSDADIAAHVASFGTKAHSKQLHFRGLRSFFGWCVSRGDLERDPTRLLHPRHPRRQRPKPYTAAELRRLVRAAFARDPKRGWAILATYSTGARRSEIVGLRLEDIDWERREVTFLGKGSKLRRVPMGPTASKAIRNLLPYSDGERLLPIVPATLNEWVKRAARDCGLTEPRKAKAHTLRATFATKLDHEGVPIAVISDLLGHESISTTTVYVGVYDGDREAATALL